MIDDACLVARAAEAPDRHSRLTFSEDAFCCHIDVRHCPGVPIANPLQSNGDIPTVVPFERSTHDKSPSGRRVAPVVRLDLPFLAPVPQVLLVPEPTGFFFDLFAYDKGRRCVPASSEHLVPLMHAPVWSELVAVAEVRQVKTLLAA